MTPGQSTDFMIESLVRTHTHKGGIVTIIIDCKVWFTLSQLIPIVLAMIVAGTILVSVHPKDIQMAWGLSRMKVVGEIIAFTIAAGYLLTVTVGVVAYQSGLLQLDGLDLAAQLPIRDQICSNR